MDKSHIRKALATSPKHDPLKDGIDHINTHNRSKTELGRMLSQFYVAPFNHPYFGRFKCIEGFWHYIRSGCIDDAFRNLNGYLAKERAREMNLDRAPKLDLLPDKRDELLLAAQYAKISQHPDIKKALIESTLPFDHYYLSGAGNVPVHPPGAEISIERCYRLRNMFQQGEEPPVIDYSAVMIIKT